VSVLDRLAKVQAARPQGGGGARMKGIYHTWKDGGNKIRLAGDFVEVRTHFIAPAPKRKDRGLCAQTAFQGDDKIPQVINCLNWDIALERPLKEKTCPICKLNAVARAVLAEKPGEDEKKFFEALRQATRATSTLKWNIIDRDDPMVIVEKNGKDEKVLGFKIASVGPEAAKDIFGILKQVGYDINDPTRGIDLEVIKDSKGARTTYSARAVIEGTSLKVTPFTKEELALEMNDLKVRCGKQTEAEKIVDALHEDLREIISANVADTTGDDETVDAAVDAAVADVSEAEAPAPVKAPVKAPAPAPVKAPAPTAGKVPSSVLDRLAKKPVSTVEAAAIQDVLGGEGTDSGDGDGLLDGTAKKK